MLNSIDRTRFLAISVLFALALMGAMPALAAYPQTITTYTPFVNLPRPSDDPRWAEAFSLWDQRDDTDELMEAVLIFEALAADKPDEMAPQLWLCRSLFIAAMRNRSQREYFAKKSVAAGDKALKIKPGDDSVRYWRAASIMLHRDFTEAELEEIREFGKRFRHLPILPGFNDPLFKKSASLWKQRGDRAKVEALIEELKKVEASAPKRVEPKIWLCAAYYTLRLFEDSDDGKAKWLEIAIGHGEAAMEIEPRNPAANSFASVSQGEYGRRTNPLNLARYGLSIGRELQCIVEEDPMYYLGGFSRYFAAAIGEAGSLVTKISGMLGFPEELIYRTTTFSVNFEPHFFTNHYDRAEMLLALDRKDEAKKELLFIINGDPASLPGHETENIYCQKDAKRLYAKHFPGE